MGVDDVLGMDVTDESVVDCGWVTIGDDDVGAGKSDEMEMHCVAVVVVIA